MAIPYPEMTIPIWRVHFERETETETEKKRNKQTDRDWEKHMHTHWERQRGLKRDKEMETKKLEDRKRGMKRERERRKKENDIERKKEETERKVQTRQRNVTFIDKIDVDLESSVCYKSVRPELHLCACADAGSTMHHGNGEGRRELSEEVHWQSSLAGCFHFISGNLQVLEHIMLR